MTVGELRKALANYADHVEVVVMLGTDDGTGALDNLRDLPIREVHNFFTRKWLGDLVSVVTAEPEASHPTVPVEADALEHLVKMARHFSSLVRCSEAELDALTEGELKLSTFRVREKKT